MLDVLVVCEGQTEREFCRELIAPDVAAYGIALAGTLVGKPQRKRGGIRNWQIYREEILRLSKERDDRHLAVLVDFYAMPGSWPGRSTASTQSKVHRGLHVEQALRANLPELTGRFHPCVQLHEFESLLFVDPEISSLSIALGGGKTDHALAAKLMTNAKIECGGSAEMINDDPDNAPSKRLARIIPGYDKVAWGITAAKDTSLLSLRSGCPWLDRWLKTLTGLNDDHNARETV